MNTLGLMQAAAVQTGWSEIAQLRILANFLDTLLNDSDHSEVKTVLKRLFDHYLEVCVYIELTTDTDDAPVRVYARVRSEDLTLRVEDIDVTPWFEQAAPEELQELSAKDWTRSEHSDQAAYLVESKLGNPALTLLMDYVRVFDIGFECIINPEQAERWVTKYRPELNLDADVL